MIAANVPVADFLLRRMFLTKNVLRFSGLVAGCWVIRIYAIYIGWRSDITLLVAALAEFVVPTGEASRMVLVMVAGGDLGTIGAELVCLSV